MVIQFQCAFCGQPIEVDDEYASSRVGCPFCKKVVAAPADSTLEGTSRVPIATPAGRAGAPEAAPTIHPDAFPSTARNTIAVVAFVLASIVVLCVLAAAIIAGAHPLELADLQRELEAGEGDMMGAWANFLERRGNAIPTWMVAVALLELGAMVLAVASVVCGLIGLFGRGRRGLAVASLCICLGVFAFVCLGALAGGL